MPRSQQPQFPLLFTLTYEQVQGLACGRDSLTTVTTVEILSRWLISLPPEEASSSDQHTSKPGCLILGAREKWCWQHRYLDCRCPLSLLVSMHHSQEPSATLCSLPAPSHSTSVANKPPVLHQGGKGQSLAVPGSRENVGQIIPHSDLITPPGSVLPLRRQLVPLLLSLSRPLGLH